MNVNILPRAGFLVYCCPKQGQDFKPLAAPLHPKIGQVPPRDLDWLKGTRPELGELVSSELLNVSWSLYPR